MPFAHSPISLGCPHDFIEHLQAVAQQPAQLAEKFGTADMAFGARR
jgi:hypothetical protein